MIAMVSALANAQSPQPARRPEQKPAALPASSAVLNPSTTPGCSVLEVTDWRTLRLRVDGVDTSIRLLGIGQAKPETASLAQASLQNLLAGETVTLVVLPGVGVDRDATPLVVLRREPEGLDVNLEVLRQGWAPIDARLAERFSEALSGPQAEAYGRAAAKAKELKRGMWGQWRETPSSKPRTPTEPASGPKGGGASGGDATSESAPQSVADQPNGQMVYVTKSGKKYHRKECRFATGDLEELTPEAARKKDYEPCSVCKPEK